MYDQYRILAKFFAGDPDDSDPDIEILRTLREYHNDIYRENRLKLPSFQVAKVMANECVITRILGFTTERKEII